MRRLLLHSLIVTLIGSPLSVVAAPILKPEQTIDYEQYHENALKLSKLRKERLIEVPEMLEMVKDKNTILLDVRSKTAFGYGHIKGATHLDYSDIAPKQLEATLPDKSARIILVCDESMTQYPTRQLKLSSDAFALLHQYGYANVYEMKELWGSKDPEAYYKLLPLEKNMNTQTNDK